MNNWRDCEHGRRAGSCDTCDLAAAEVELSALRTQAEQLSRAYGMMVAERNALNAKLEDAESRCVALEKGGQLILADLKAANECARINAENSSHWHGEAMSLQAQLAQQPASAVPDEALYAAAKEFYNSTIADPCVIIRPKNEKGRDHIQWAGEKLRLALIAASPTAQAEKEKGE